jgi:hypothetical protein
LATTDPTRTVWRNATGKGTYRQQMNMAMAVYQPDQGMMMNVRQYLQGTRNMPMMQMGQQPMAAPMLMNHYASNH